MSGTYVCGFCRRKCDAVFAAGPKVTVCATCLYPVRALYLGLTALGEKQ